MRFLILVLIPFQVARSQVAPTTIDSLTAFFRGRWGCDGKFSNGSPIAADVTFEPTLDGKWLAYTHTDRPPGRFKMNALWGRDAANNTIISLAADNGGGYRVFRAPAWDGTLVLERTSIGDSIPRPERFTYHRESDSTFRMTYEVRASTSPWRMGDYIVCARR